MPDRNAYQTPLPGQGEAGVWRAAPGKPPLQRGEVHVWRADLKGRESLTESFEPTLGDDGARAARFYFEADRRRFIASHGIVRAILSLYTGVEAGSLGFVLGAHGKPSLAAGQTAADIRFNMSHSQEVVVCAVTVGREVGVDVEYTNRRFSVAGIAERFFSQKESRAICALSGSEQIEAFFNCWTRKEAYVKARGLGLTLRLDSFGVSAAALRHCEEVPAELPPDASGRWSIVNIEVAADYAAALAIEGDTPKVDCLDWEAAL